LILSLISNLSSTGVVGIAAWFVFLVDIISQCLTGSGGIEKPSALDSKKPPKATRY
jgi:hypothetical protein